MTPQTHPQNMRAACIPLLPVLGPIVLVTLDPNVVTDAIAVVVNPSDGRKESFDGSVCKSGPVRSFGPKMQDQDRDWFTFVLEPKKTGPVKCLIWVKS